MYDYRRGDFTALRSALESLNLSGLILSDGDINEDWRNWKDTFLATVSDHIPSTKLRSRYYVPWMNSAIMHNIQKKNSVRRKLRKSPTSTNLKEKFKHLRIAIKKCCVKVVQSTSTLFVMITEITQSVSGRSSS